MKLKTLLISAAATAVLAIAGQASAAVITYTFTGSGTGSLDGTAFTNFAVTLVGNTNTVTFDGSEFHSDASLASVSVNLGTASDTLLNASSVVLNTSVAPASPSFLGFANVTATPFNVVDESITNHLFDSYDLKSAFASTGGDLSVAPGDIATVGGTLHFDSISSMTFSAAVAAVPEPATWSLMLMGLGGLGAAMRLGRSRKAVASAA